MGIQDVVESADGHYLLGCEVQDLFVNELTKEIQVLEKVLLTKARLNFHQIFSAGLSPGNRVAGTGPTRLGQHKDGFWERL